MGTFLERVQHNTSQLQFGLEEGVDTLPPMVSHQSDPNKEEELSCSVDSDKERYEKVLVDSPTKLKALQDSFEEALNIKNSIPQNMMGSRDQNNHKCNKICAVYCQKKRQLVKYVYTKKSKHKQTLVFDIDETLLHTEQVHADHVEDLPFEPDVLADLGDYMFMAITFRPGL